MRIRMGRHGGTGIAVAGLLGTLAMTLLGAPVAAARPARPACHVWNVTRGTAGTSLPRMVRAAHDGDRLAVHGTCPGGVVVRRDIVIRGLGKELPVLVGDGEDTPVSVHQGASARIRHLKIVGSRGTFVVENLGGLDLTDVVLEGGEAGGIDNAARGRMTVTDAVIRDNRGGNGGITNWGTMRLSHSIVRGNSSFDSWGGGITNWGTLVVVRSIVRGNVAGPGFDVGGSGGGIHNAGTMRVHRSRVTGNRAEGGVGAGIYTEGTLVLRRTTVDVNHAQAMDGAGGAGGGLYVSGSASGIGEEEPGLTRLSESTVTGNTADGDGGGIASSGELALVGTTVTGNTAGGTGGGIRNLDGSVTRLDGSSVTGNAPDDCVGTPAC